MRPLLLPSALFAASALAACPAPNPPPADAPHTDASSDDTAAPPPADTPAVPGCDYDGGAEPEVPTPPIHTPRWAFEPWISKDISTTDDTYAFVEGFRSRDIPVGVVVLDSPWETNYNTFVPNPTRYRDFARLVSDLHARDIRLVLWVTQFVNRASYDLETGGDQYMGASPNYTQGRRCGFYVNNGAVYDWWKGNGASVDFFNGAARAWWHRQQDPLLAMGIDGWKLDFGDSYVTTDPVMTAMGPVPHQRYSEEYYRDYWAYGVQRRGREFLTMVRPYDASYQFPGRFFARAEHAPVAWVGDNRRDWVGLVDALDHTFRSARAGYVVVGSDLGGYLDRDDQNLLIEVPADQDTFARWTAHSALTPFMQLHGRANLAPWTVTPRTDETVALYRYWSTLHHELVPFFYSLAEESYRTRTTIIRPVGETPESWANDWRYHLGDAFLVAPLFAPGGRRDVALPAGANYYDWWDPAGEPIAGGTVLRDYDCSADQRRIPVFVREGAIIPLNVATALTGLGTPGSAGHLTVLVYPGPRASAFVVHDEDGMTTRIELDAPGTSGAVTVRLSRATRPVLLRVRGTAGRTVTVDGAPLASVPDRAALDAASTGTFYDPAVRSYWIKLPAAPTARAVTISGM